MKLSLKTEYACRVLVQLARRHHSGVFAHIDDLAGVEQVPQNYLVQILNELRNGGLIVSRRGKLGGYALSRDPALISLHDIVKVIDSELLEVTVHRVGDSGAVVADVWEDIGAELEEKIRAHTLESICARDGASMYHI